MLEDKYIITPNELLRDSYALGAKVIKSGFQPNFLIAMWRGGTTVGIAVHELLKHCNIHTDHIAVRTGRYDRGIDKPKPEVTVDGLDYVLERGNEGDKVLVVDDIYDTGKSIEAFLREFAARARANMPKEIATIIRQAREFTP